MLGNFKFTDTSAGNFHSQVLVNPYTDLPIRGKYIPLTKTIKLHGDLSTGGGVILLHKKFTYPTCPRQEGV